MSLREYDYLSVAWSLRWLNQPMLEKEAQKDDTSKVVPVIAGEGGGFIWGIYYANRLFLPPELLDTWIWLLCYS